MKTVNRKYLYEKSRCAADIVVLCSIQERLQIVLILKYYEYLNLLLLLFESVSYTHLLIVVLVMFSY